MGKVVVSSVTSLIVQALRVEVQRAWMAQHYDEWQLAAELLRLELGLPVRAYETPAAYSAHRYWVRHHSSKFQQKCTTKIERRAALQRDIDRLLEASL